MRLSVLVWIQILNLVTIKLECSLMPLVTIIGSQCMLMIYLLEVELFC
jgi:hypothetical protein